MNLIKANLQTENFNENNLNVTIKGQNKNTGLISIEDDDIISVSNSQDKNATITMNLNNIDYLHVYVDPNNKVAEPKDDNYILMPFVKRKLKANLSVDTGYDKVDSAIKNYLSFYIDDITQSLADVVVSIGRHTSEVTNYNDNTLDQGGRDWGWNKKKGRIVVDDKPLEMDYSGLVGSYKPIGATARIFIYGNRIEGTIAALKEFISARDVFFNNQLYIGTETFQNKKLVILDKYDTTALGVFDLMHNAENGPASKDFDSQDFADVVTRILNDNNFEISIKTVKTTNDNTTLRLKHINTDYSDNFIDAVVNNSKPVAIGNGAWTNMNSMQEIGKSISSDEENARDVYLIEITGGPLTECSTCPNYSYEDLTDYYFPALIAGVEYYSGQNTIDYVGYSNGCRVALDSLKNWSASGKNNAGYCYNSENGLYDVDCDLASEPIDSFVGVACPGAFEGTSPFSLAIRAFGGKAISSLEEEGVTHINSPSLFARLFWNAITKNESESVLLAYEAIKGDRRISLNLAKKYYDFTKLTDDVQPGNGLSLNKLTLINGLVELKFPFNLYFSDSDRLVTLDDQNGINESINSDYSKKHIFGNIDHFGIKTYAETIKRIKEAIND